MGIMPRTQREEVMFGLPLNEREIEVLEWAARGYMGAGTGEQMGLTEHTIRDYRRRATAKLAARNLTHAVVIAVALGLVNIEGVLEEYEQR